jgi:hypothetical protein
MLLQTDSELEYYKHHTAQWDARVTQAAAQMEKDIAENDDLIQAKENSHRPEHYQTVDAAEEYNGMLV